LVYVFGSGSRLPAQHGEGLFNDHRQLWNGEGGQSPIVTKAQFGS
jgi:hypothetical protein